MALGHEFMRDGGQTLQRTDPWAVRARELGDALSGIGFDLSDDELAAAAIELEAELPESSVDDGPLEMLTRLVINDTAALRVYCNARRIDAEIKSQLEVEGFDPNLVTWTPVE